MLGNAMTPVDEKIGACKKQLNRSPRRSVQEEIWRQKYERYLELARLEARGGDRVRCENYAQHAEHYYRMLQGGDQL